MLYKEIIAVCSHIHTKHINTLCGQNVEFDNVKLAVHIVTTGGTYSDHWAVNGRISVIRTSQLMLQRELIAVCSQNHTKHKNNVWAERRIVEC